MIKQMQKKIIILALFAGEIMMKSGAEIYRVEDTITRICRACNIPYVEVFVTPTGIFLSLDKGDDSEMFTFIKRIKGTGIDLGKISEINQFSRDFVNTDLSIEEGMERIKQIAQSKPYNMWIKSLGAALACAFFCLLFNGSIQDFACAFVIGAVSYLLSIGFEQLETNYFIKGFCCTAFAAFLALICTAMGLGNSSGPITIGALMLFVPGVAITNAIRDFLVGDMLSGVARTAEAFFIAISLATGAGVVLRLWVLFGGKII
ncbi:MAG: threonine/serine exporter family protein [Clostridiales bacterium]|uniref:threonine/serine ThrE exporter family protein n=1 Tax=Aminipila sp. TaxID=2060095 RepID=UPI001DC414FE|nr:threonine/serine exporter family protein [Aminipila sp.]MBE6033462.1 threonine/serine exporter family protein [Clostridiales bacterium]